MKTPASRLVPLLHVCETLKLGGRGRVMMNFARSQRGGMFRPILAGLRSAGSQTLEVPGIETAVIGPAAEGIRNVVDEGEPFVVVIHRAGNESAEWNAVVARLRAEGARVVVDANVFGYADTGQVAEQTDLVIANSLHTLWRHWVAVGQPSIDLYLEKHRVIYNPVGLGGNDVDLLPPRLALRRECGIPDNAVVFFDLCRPAPEKLDWLVVEVMRKLADELPDLHFIARSFPPEAANALKRAMGSRFHSLPISADEADVEATIAAGDVLFHMSSMGESFGMAVGESMACGRPAIVNATPGKRQNNAQIELVCNGETGFVVNGPKDALDRARLLASDADLRSIMGARSRQRFASGALNSETVVSELNIELYQRFQGLAPPQERLPSLAVCKHYLETYAQQTITPLPLSLSRPVSEYWALKTNLARLMWRVMRRGNK